MIAESLSCNIKPKTVSCYPRAKDICILFSHIKHKVEKPHIDLAWPVEMSSECFSLVMKLSRALFLANGLHAVGWPDFINLSELHMQQYSLKNLREFWVSALWEKSPHNTYYSVHMLTQGTPMSHILHSGQHQHCSSVTLMHLELCFLK